MAEFEELRLTVNLVDNASSGLQRLRGEIGQLTQSAGQMTTAANTAAAGITNLGNVTNRAVPGVRTLATEVKSLERSAYDTGRGITTMATAVMQGGRSLPMLAIGLREATTGVSGLGESMAALGPSARIATLAIGGMAVGVVALGAAVVMYGVSVFKFAKEMDNLAKTARMIGLSFAELKNAQDQARMFGQSADSVVRNMQGIQAAQLDLYKNNSQLRQRLLGQGVNADWVTQLATAEPTKAHNMIVQYGKALEKEALDAKVGATVARAIRNQFLSEFGLSADAEMIKPIDPAVARKLEEIGKISGQIAKVWGEIDNKLQNLKLDALSAGLPLVLSTLKGINAVFDAISATIGKINEGLALIGTSLGGIIKTNLSAVIGMIPGLGPLLKGLELFGKVKGLAVGSAAAAEGNPTAQPSDSFTDRFDALKSPMSLRGANDNANPLLQRASFTTDELVDETDRNTTETAKLTGQLEKLNAFYDRLQNGQTGGGRGGGFQNAAFTTGGNVGGGGSGGGGAASFGSPEYPNLGGGGGASSLGGGGVPSSLGGGQVPQSLDGGGPSGSRTGGPTGGGGSGPAGDPSVPSDILSRAKEVALKGGPGGVESFMRSQGYPKAGAWCGEFAASVVKSVGGTPPKNAAIASNWRNWGTPVDSPQPGDVAVRKGGRGGYVPTGATGSHVTFVEGVDPKTGKFTGLGGNQGRFQSQYASGQYEFRRGGKVDGMETAAAPGAAGAPAGGAGGPISGGGDVNEAIRATANKAGMDEAHWKAMASIESNLKPGSNANKATQYKGLFQIGSRGAGSEWSRMGGGDIYNARDNAEAAARLAADNNARFKARFGRDPSPTETYMMHQQGLGFYTKGKMTNVAGNPYPGMQGQQTPQSFEAGWGREIERRAAGYTDRSSLDRTALSNKTEVNASGKLSVDVNAPPSTKVEASGSGLFKNTELQRSTAMPYTGSGPSASETANQYMASR